MTTFLIFLAPLSLIAFAVGFRLWQVRRARRAVDAVDAHWHSLPASLKGDRNV